MIDPALIEKLERTIKLAADNLKANKKVPIELDDFFFRFKKTEGLSGEFILNLFDFFLIRTLGGWEESLDLKLNTFLNEATRIMEKSHD